jgi:cytochrome c553
MRKSAVVLGILAVMASGVALAQTAANDPVPYWAYPVPEKTGPAPKLDDTIKKHVPHSKASFTEAQTNDRFHVPDWHPEGHPAMPTIISSGKPPNVMACGYCHLPNGHGRPENAPLAGQPAAYLIEQVTDMKAGRRKSSEPHMGSINSMVKIAAAVSPEDLKTAAEYFEKTKYTKWIRVVEADMVPKTEVSSHNMLVPKAGGGKEKLGDRIIEMPANLERTELRDAASGFVAYVPKGSIARGKKLVEAGAGAFPCASCHGDNLKGDGNVPGLAGRSPSMIVRQLYDFKAGTRGGPNADPMKPEVASMTAAMRLDIAAYLASLNP